MHEEPIWVFPSFQYFDNYSDPGSLCLYFHHFCWACLKALYFTWGVVAGEEAAGSLGLAYWCRRRRGRLRGRSRHLHWSRLALVTTAPRFEMYPKTIALCCHRLRNATQEFQFLRTIVCFANLSSLMIKSYHVVCSAWCPFSHHN